MRAASSWLQFRWPITVALLTLNLFVMLYWPYLENLEPAMDEVSIDADDRLLLATSIRVLCVVQTTSSDGKHEKRAALVRQTWGRRCTRLIFASDQDDPNLPAYAFTQPGRAYVSFKIRAAFRFVYFNYLNEFDWVIKADDDTFVIMENLRDFLSDYDPNRALFFGREFVTKNNKTVYAAGSAYVLSRRAFLSLVEDAFELDDTKLCPSPRKNRHEDTDTGTCLASVGVRLTDSRDYLGRQRFLIFSPWKVLLPGGTNKTLWIWQYDRHGYTEGEGCCSDSVISLHYVAGGHMLSLEYLLYRVKIAGRHYYTSHVGSAKRLTFERLRRKLVKNNYKIYFNKTVINRY